MNKYKVLIENEPRIDSSSLEPHEAAEIDSLYAVLVGRYGVPFADAIMRSHVKRISGETKKTASG